MKQSDLHSIFLEKVGHKKFSTVLADPPWQFTNRTGKIAPEHKRLNRYGTLNLEDPINSGKINLISKESINSQVKYSLSNSFGFGGTNTALLFKSI